MSDRALRADVEGSVVVVVTGDSIKEVWRCHVMNGDAIKKVGRCHETRSGMDAGYLHRPRVICGPEVQNLGSLLVRVPRREHLEPVNVETPQANTDLKQCFPSLRRISVIISKENITYFVR